MKATPLTPLKSYYQKKKLKQLRGKQNNWVLDCLNRQKSKLKPYSSFKDKYLKYFVIGVPKKKRVYKKQKEIMQKTVESDHFKNFLQKKKDQILKNQINGVVRKNKLAKTEQKIPHDPDENYYTQNQNLISENEEISGKNSTRKNKSIDQEEQNQILIKEQCSNIGSFISKTLQDQNSSSQKYMNIEKEINLKKDQDHHENKQEQQEDNENLQCQKEENILDEQKPMPLTIKINEVQTPQSSKSINENQEQIKIPLTNRQCEQQKSKQQVNQNIEDLVNQEIDEKIKQDI